MNYQPLNYQSQACQDKFVHKLLLAVDGYLKEDGYFLDIGSCDYASCNNTFAFDEAGWDGICIEMNPEHNDSYKKRQCKYINADATQVDYKELFKDGPFVIDYLSLDVDHASTAVLEKLPFDLVTFRVITIEHDAYLHGNIYRNAQRAILKAAGYVLLCADTLVPLQDDTLPDCPFEDWYVHQDMMVPAKLFCERLYPQQIIDLL